MIDLCDVQAARGRITGAIRRTPMITATAVRQPLQCGPLSLKLELLQATGSFKARGAVNKARALTPEQAQRGMVTASGGNHGLAVAYAARMVGVPATIYLPEAVHPDKIKRLQLLNARAVIEGETWDISNRSAVAFAEQEGVTYIHPFADPLVVAGQGTIALEILEDAPDVDLLLVAIGGGGLIAGVATAAKALKPRLRIIGVEPVGAPTLAASLQAGEIVSLPSLHTAAVTLSAGRTEPLNFELVRQHVDEIVLVTDEEMRDAARWLWSEFGIAAELSGAASVAALASGRIETRGATSCALVCGIGRDGLA